jgi:peptidyl-prolyl cis-trans isomerase SurA
MGRSRLLATCLCLGATLLAGVPTARARIVDRIAAVVNTDVIALSEVDAFLSKRPDLAEELKDPDTREQVLGKHRKEALEHLVAERLLEAEIRKRDLRATELQIERTFELQLQANHTTREKFVEELAKAGLSLAQYRAELAKRLQRQMLLDRLFIPKINIKDEDVQSYYNQNLNVIQTESREVCASHILRHTPKGMAPADVEAQRRHAEQVAAQAKGGADFAVLAQQNSQDPTGPRGGQLGCFRKGVMVPEFEQAAFALKKGEVSGVVKSPFGFHVILVTDIKGTAVKPFKEARDMIRMKLLQDAMEKLVQRWVEEEKKKAFIDRKL